MDSWAGLALLAISIFTVLVLLFIVGIGLTTFSAVRLRKNKTEKGTISLAIGIAVLSIPLLFGASVWSGDMQSQNDMDRMEKDCLFRVVENNNYERAKELLNEGIHPDCSVYMSGKNILPSNTDPDKVGWTPLSYAIKNGNYEMAEMLLQYGADPNLRFVHVHSPIQYAIDYNRHEILQLLIDYGGDPNAYVSDSRDHPYLILAIEECDAVSAEILLRNGADPNAVNLSGYSALYLSEMRAKSSQYTEDEQKNCAEIAKLLKQYLAE